MPEQPHLGLNNPAFRGRLRQPSDWSLASRRSDYVNRPSPIIRRKTFAAAPQIAPTPPPVESILPNPGPFQPHRPGALATSPRRHSRPQLALMGMAGLVFVIGLAVSLQTLVTNHTATAQVSALAKQADQQAASSAASTRNSSVPSITKPSAQAFNNYAVAPDLPRYLKIPKLGVDARVLQVGVTTSGALGTPDNVFDTAWYTGSAKPGQPGATLIDGHVSSWTTHGVFYGIKTLQPGDTMQIVRGDGAVLTYQVVKTQTYPADNVNMQAAVTPVAPGVSGLNLITCTGQVEKGTSQFNQRVIVFTKQL